MFIQQENPVVDFPLIYGIFNCTWKPRFFRQDRQYVSAAAMAATWIKVSYRLRLAVDEIATIIVHGYEKSRGKFEVSGADINEQDLTILIEDTGVAYDPSQKPPQLT